LLMALQEALKDLRHAVQNRPEESGPEPPPPHY